MIDTREYISNLNMPEKVSLFKELYNELAGYGIEGDTELAHVNTFEASLLKSLGGSGTINEITNLREYKGGGSAPPPPPATQSVTQQTEFPEELKPFISDILGEGQAEFRREKAEGFQPFPGAQIAGFTPEQQAAFETGRQQFTGLAGTPLGRASTYYAPALAATALGTAEIDEADIQRRMDPFLQNVVDIAKREAQRDEEAAIQGRAAQAVGAGSFGGTRQGLVEAEAERNLAERLGDIQARGLSVAFQNAQQAAEQQRQRELGGGRQFAALGDVTGQRARADIAGLAGVGETQQQRNQQALDIARQEFLQEQQFPASTLQKYASLVRGFPYTMGGTTVSKQTVPTPSFAQTLTGGLGTAAGLYGMFGGFKPSKEGGLVSLQGGGQPQVPVGAQKMVPMLMNMYNANPAFRNKIDRMIAQQSMPKATGINMGLQGSQVNLGTQGGMEQGGLVSLANGGSPNYLDPSIIENIRISQRDTIDPIRTRMLEQIQKQPSLADVQKERREWYADQETRAQDRKMQALYASLIAGGAGVLGADPQRGYAAAVGEGIKAGLPVAAAGMEDYHETMDKAAGLQREEEIAERTYDLENIGKEYTLARSEVKDNTELAELQIGLESALAQQAQFKFQQGIGQKDIPNIDLAVDYIHNTYYGGPHLVVEQYAVEYQQGMDTVIKRVKDRIETEFDGAMPGGFVFDGLVREEANIVFPDLISKRTATTPPPAGGTSGGVRPSGGGGAGGSSASSVLNNPISQWNAVFTAQQPPT